MISFGSDNHSGVHPKILNALIAANTGHAPSYGTCDWTLAATEKLKSVFGPEYEPFFVFNGTAANVLSLGALLKPYQSVLTSEEAHLHLDECGAPEAILGCKVIPVPSQNGKITPQSLLPFLIRKGDQHFSQPKVVSITLPSELGVCYSLSELRGLGDFCQHHNIMLHIDGARFIYAPYFLKCTFQEVLKATKASAVSFGGTKNGLLFGETVLLKKEIADDGFRFLRKQKMQLPSKMRFLAAQFLALFENDLWQSIASHGHQMALDLRDQLQMVSQVQIHRPVQANSVFACFPKNWIKELKDTAFFYIWNESTYEARLMMSFDVEKEHIDRFVSKVKSLAEKEKR